MSKEMNYVYIPAWPDATAQVWHLSIEEVVFLGVFSMCNTERPVVLINNLHRRGRPVNSPSPVEVNNPGSVQSNLEAFT